VSLFIHCFTSFFFSFSCLSSFFCSYFPPYPSLSLILLPALSEFFSLFLIFSLNLLIALLFLTTFIIIIIIIIIIIHFLSLFWSLSWFFSSSNNYCFPSNSPPPHHIRHYSSLYSSPPFCHSIGLVQFRIWRHVTSTLNNVSMEQSSFWEPNNQSADDELSLTSSQQPTTGP